MQMLFRPVDTDAAELSRYAEGGWLTFANDAARTAVARQAQVGWAQGLVTSATADSTNLHIILTARSLDPKLKIIARASDDGVGKRLRTVGANHVTSSYYFGRDRSVQAFMRPHVVDHLIAMGDPEGLRRLEQSAMDKA